MPYQRLAAEVLARWRDVERALKDASDDAAEDLRAEAAHLRDEYQRLVRGLGHPEESKEAEALKAAVVTTREAIARGERPQLHATAEGAEPAITVRVTELPGIQAIAHDHRMVHAVATALAASALDVPEGAVDIHLV